MVSIEPHLEVPWLTDELAEQIVSVAAEAGAWPVAWSPARSAGADQTLVVAERFRLVGQSLVASRSLARRSIRTASRNSPEGARSDWRRIPTGWKPTAW